MADAGEAYQEQRASQGAAAAPWSSRADFLQVAAQTRFRFQVLPMPRKKASSPCRWNCVLGPKNSSK
eukprot:scaffold621_cov191-Pinguiococcus_pyrenoidosus.AAC.1